MTRAAAAPPYPRSGPEGVRPQPLGVTRVRLGTTVAAWSVGVVAALLVSLAVLVVRPVPLGSASNGDLRVTTTSSSDRLIVRLERTGWLSRDLDAVCADGLSVAPVGARVSWTGSSTVAVDVRGSDASGRWRFEVVDDTLVSVGRPAMRAC